MALTRQQALDCFRSDDLIGLGMEADAVRRRLHPEGVVTYALVRALPWPENAADLERQVRSAVELGASAVQFTGALPSGPDLAGVESLLRNVRQNFPQLSLIALTPADVRVLAVSAKETVESVLSQLRTAGLDALAACNDPLHADLLELHRTAHALGLRTTASLLFGAGESFEQRVDALLSLRALQEETGGFISFQPAPFRPAQSHEPDEPTAVETLKMLAVARMVLDNIPHLQSNPATHGLKVLQMGLRFGADDAGALPLEGGVKAHKASALTEEELRRLIREAGFQPVERDAEFTACFLR